MYLKRNMQPMYVLDPIVPCGVVMLSPDPFHGAFIVSASSSDPFLSLLSSCAVVLVLCQPLNPEP